MLAKSTRVKLVSTMIMLLVACDVAAAQGVPLPRPRPFSGVTGMPTPPPKLRCTMAEAIVEFVRADAVPLTRELGGILRALQNFDSYDCRGRNRVVGARTSEHGKGNALDVRGFTLTSGRFIELTDPHVPRDFREKLRKNICARFTTVLGPGSDGYHENHIHMDLAERRSGWRSCNWDVRDLEPAAPAAAAAVPLPPPRPKIEQRAGRKL